MKVCPICGNTMDPGIRWSRSRKRIKIFYACHFCRKLFYRSDMKVFESENEYEEVKK